MAAETGTRTLVFRLRSQNVLNHPFLGYFLKILEPLLSNFGARFLCDPVPTNSYIDYLCKLDQFWQSKSRRLNRRSFFDLAAELSWMLDLLDLYGLVMVTDKVNVITTIYSSVDNYA